MQACNDTEQVASMNGMDAAGAQLDWFGVAVKAAEIPVWTARMKMLAKKVWPCLHPALSSQPETSVRCTRGFFGILLSSS